MIKLNEGESKTPEKNGKEITVNIQDGKDREQAKKYRKKVEQLQNKLYEKFQDDNIFLIDDLDELTSEYLAPEKEPNRKPPKGVVGIKPSGSGSKLLKREFTTQKGMIETLAERACRGDKEALQTLDELWSKPSNLKGLSNMKMIINPPPPELKTNHSWYDHVKYMQQKGRESKNNE